MIGSLIGGMIGKGGADAAASGITNAASNARTTNRVRDTSPRSTSTKAINSTGNLNVNALDDIACIVLHKQDSTVANQNHRAKR